MTHEFSLQLKHKDPQNLICIRYIGRYIQDTFQKSWLFQVDHTGVIIDWMIFGICLLVRTF